MVYYNHKDGVNPHKKGRVNMKRTEFYEKTSVAQAKAAVKFRNKYYICMALDTITTAFVHRIINRHELHYAWSLIHEFGQLHGVDY